MMQIEVFHVAFENSPRHVATLRSAAALMPALEEAYTGTQTVESDWVQSRGQFGVSIEPTAEVLAAQECRSTSVGDYARVLDEQGAESFWRCASLGWRQIVNPAHIAFVGCAALRAAYEAPAVS